MPLDQLTQTMSQQGKKLNKRTSKGSKEEILINPKDDDRPIQEASESTAVMTFGRFNPPTVGHEKLIHKVHSTAQEHGGSSHVFASHSEGSSKDPVPQKNKIGYLKKVAPQGATVHGSSKAEPTFLHAAKKLSDAGHQHLVMVAGSDRVKEYEDRLNKYNGKEGHHNFKSIKVVSSGERDPDAEGVEGMSGTKMRAHARAGEKDKFKSGLPKALHPHADEITNHINAVKEDVNDIFRSFTEQLTYNKEKNQKQRGVRFSYLAKMNAGNHETNKGIHDSVSYEQFSKIMDIVELTKVSVTQRNPKGPEVQTVGADVGGDDRPNRAEKIRTISIKHLKAHGNEGDKATKGKASPESENKVQSMVKHLQGGKTLPHPLVDHQGAVLDGHHTVEAHRRLGLKTMKVRQIPKALIKKTVNNESYITALKFKSYMSDVPFDILEEIYNRGVNEWSNLDYTTQTAQQHGFNRVNSFLSGGRAIELDADLYETLREACWVGYKSIGTKKKNGREVPNCVKTTNEDLRDWFKQKWVRMDTKGNIKGQCAREPGEGKPKCLPQAKAVSIGKAARGAAARRKRREDPNPERSGKPINVRTK